MHDYELLLFTTNPELAGRALRAGVRGIVIDWEYRGKERRQEGADTQINHDTPADLARMRRLVAARIIVRVNGLGAWTPREVGQAVDGGADEILVPMVRSLAQVERVLQLVRERVAVGILIETRGAAVLARPLGQLPLRRVYVGLNDLAIERRTPNIFTPLVDGTLAAIRRGIETPFGFGGLTLPGCGSPIPSRLLMGEMARLGTAFSFLRRSFLADLAGRRLDVEVPRILQAMHEARLRNAAQIAADRAALILAINRLRPAVEASDSIIGVQRRHPGAIPVDGPSASIDAGLNSRNHIPGTAAPATLDS